MKQLHCIYVLLVALCRANVYVALPDILILESKVIYVNDS